MANFRNTIKSLITNHHKQIAKEIIGIKNKKLLLSKQSFEDLKFPPWCSSFYKQVMECWFDFFSKEPDSYLEIIQENIINNRFIIIGNEQLDKNFISLK